MSENTSKKTFALSAAGISALLVAAFALLSGGDITSIRTTLGAGTSSYSDPTTTIGDLVTRGDAGVTRIAIGADASVLTSVAGRAQWAAPASSSPTTTRGDLIRRGASADERLALGTSGYVLTAGATDPAWAAPAVTASQISDSTSTGRALLTAATAGSARAVLWPYPVAMLAGGLEGDWSALGASPAGSSASITGGQVTITMAASSCDWTAAPCATDAIRAVRSIPFYTMSDWSLRARLVSATSNGYFVPMFGVTTSATAWSTSVAKYVLYFAGNSDTVTLMRIAGSGGAAGSASISGIRGGQGWFRIDHMGGRVVAYGGVGSAGAEPTSWTVVGGMAMSATDPPPQRVVIGAHGSVAASAVWDLVRLQPAE